MIVEPNIELIVCEPSVSSIFFDVVCSECGTLEKSIATIDKANLVRSGHLIEHHTEMILELSEKLQQLKESILWGRTDNAEY